MDARLPLRQPQPRHDAWIEAAFRRACGRGIDAVRVDPLAKQLGVTRGSFYWHFKDRAALRGAAPRMANARQLLWCSNALCERLRARRSFEAHLPLPNSSPRATRAARIEMAIRFWAYRDKAAASRAPTSTTRACDISPPSSASTASPMTKPGPPISSTLRSWRRPC